MHRIYLLLYYGFARFLPKSTTPLLGKFAKALRRFLCKRIFLKAGEKLNVEQGAYFGNGRDIEVGYEVGFGRNFQCRNIRLRIGDYLMMGEDVLFREENINSTTQRFPWVIRARREKQIW